MRLERVPSRNLRAGLAAAAGSAGDHARTGQTGKPGSLRESARDAAPGITPDGAPEAATGLLGGIRARARRRRGAHEAAPAQNLAVPSYFRPGPLWQRLQAGAPAVGLVVMNPENGPADQRDHRYAEQVRQSQAAGLRVLGYVYTRYADGSRSVEAVRDAIDRYYDWYGVDGIVFDEVSTDRSRLPYYATLNAYVKARAPTAVTVINPGTRTRECYMDVADIVVTFEGPYTAYLARYTAPDWVARYPPSRFWHVVHSTPRMEDMLTAVQLSKARRAGWIYVTDDLMPNPWDTLPDGDYWQAELQAVAGVQL
jgi:hypothetical protein